MSDESQLYRHYNIGGELLYVGVSLNSLKRLGQHKYHSQWFNSIANVTIEKFDSRADALSAETEAIKKEKPKFNLTCRHDDSPSDRSPAEVSRRELMANTVSFKPLYNLREASEALGIGVSALKRRIEEGELGHAEMRGKYFITGWQMIDFLEFISVKRSNGIEE